MRIVGGIYKGRTLVSFSGQDIRPTSDMVRESLFNVLQFEISGKTFLDLFCGTGAMGIEALSRGASEVVLNDFSRESLAVAKKNVEKIANPKNLTIENKDAITFLQKTDKKFDFVFIDPPYKTDLGERALDIVSKVLTENGKAIFESERRCAFLPKGLKKIDERKYGRAIVTFFSKGE